MVDVGSKRMTNRIATAHARVSMSSAAFHRVMENRMKKGDVFAAAQIGGVMGAKKTSELIPLCHPLSLDHVEITFSPDPAAHSIEITGTCRVTGKTGVEMEALTAVSIAALTLYDMCKAVDPSMTIDEIYLIKKTGGRRGPYRRKKI